MTLVAHFDLELHQMVVKTNFLNVNLKRRFTLDNLKVSWITIRMLGN
jgi:hypothetical protein